MSIGNRVRHFTSTGQQRLETTSKTQKQMISQFRHFIEHQILKNPQISFCEYGFYSKWRDFRWSCSSVRERTQLLVPRLPHGYQTWANPSVHSFGAKSQGSHSEWALVRQKLT